MDISAIGTLLFITFIVGVLVNFILKRLALYKRMPPGPWGYPIVGSMVHLIKNNCITEFEKYKKIYGKVFSLTIGDSYVIVVNDYKLIHEILRRDEFTGRPNFKVWESRNLGDRNRGILFSDGPVWHEQRRFALRNLRDFGFGKESMEGLLIHELEELIKHLRKNVDEPFRLGNIFNASVLNSLWFILTGKRYDLDDPQFKLLISMLTETLQNAVLPQPGFFLYWLLSLNLVQPKNRANSIASRIKTQEMINKQIEEHIKTYEENTTRDFIDAYLHQIYKSDSSSSFFDEEGKKNLLIVLHDLFVAGAETTSTTLLWSILYLTQHPAVQKKVQEEIDLVIGTERFPTREDKAKLPYVEAFLNEVHRYCSLIPVSVYHRMTKDAELNGYLLPKDSVVWANIHDAHHDPEYWKDPENFRPERFLDESEAKLVKHDPLMPFSTGKRVCLGEALARDTLFLFFTGIVQKFSFEADPAAPKVPLKGNPTFVTSPNPFKVVIKNRTKKTD